ncbi:ribosomal subunit 39S-domain-containing protein [Peziza echinospora]|nr:ribosomal subunit 39S-domain-containing protein [Peziza echinospora]
MRVALARLQPSVCLRCRLLPAVPFTARAFTSAPRSLAEPEKLTIEERLKQRIWGSSAAKSTGPQVSQLPDVEKALLTTPTVPGPQDKYVMDLDGRGLRVIGIVDKLGKKTGQWKIESFAPKEKVTDSERLTELVHHAVVITYTNVLHGKDAQPYNEGALQWTKKVKVTKDEASGEFEFDYGSQEVIDGILNASPSPTETTTTTIPTETVDASTSLSDGTPVADPTTEVTIPVSEVASPISDSAAPEPSQNFGNDWLNLSLAVPAVKFAINKRIIASTGHILSDITLNQITTVSQLLEALLTPPRRTEKLDLLNTTPELAELPNVAIYESRLRPLDKEKMKGRLSPLQKELLENKAKLERGDIKPEETEDFKYGWEGDKYFHPRV